MMRDEMKPIFLWTWGALLLLGALVTPPSSQAQGQPEDGSKPQTATDAESGGEAAQDAGAGGEAGAAGEEAGTPAPPTEAASDATRIVRIREVIDLGIQRMRWLRRELRSRTRWFEDLSAAMSDLAEERDEKKAELEALDANPESDPDEIAALRAELEDLQQDYEIFDTQTDLALSVEKTIQEQISALEEKIAKEKHALGVLSGEIEVTLPETPSTEVTGPAKPAEAAKPMPLPSPMPAPVTPPAPEQTEASSTMTAAQLEARTALEQKEEQVQLAKLALSDFVERKHALEQQIEFEKGLAETNAAELENLQLARGHFEARLQEYRQAKAAPEKLQHLEHGIQRIVSLSEEWQKSQEARAAYIESLSERFALLESERLRVTADVDEKEREAEEARRHVLWLQSPIHPANIEYWAKERGPRILLVIVAAMILLLIVQLSARRIARTFVRKRRGPRSGGTGRADTLAFSFRSASRVVIVVFGTLLVLQEAGVNIKTVLGGAAILGVAIAFGAQDLMRDYFSGFLILIEDQYQLGDLVTIGTITGTVESVNMRVTVLRDLEGRVHFIPNGNIDHVTNRTYAWGRPVFEIPVGYDEDVDMVMKTLVEIAKELGEDPDWKDAIIGDPDMLGVDKFSEYGVIIKFMVKTRPEKLFPVRREMLRRISKRFHERGIQITVPQRIIVRDGGDTHA